MSEANKTLLRHYAVDEVWRKRNLGALEELMSLDFLDHADKEVYAAPPRVSGGSTRNTKRPSPTPTM